MTQLVYQCRRCHGEVTLLADSLDGLSREDFDARFLEMPRQIVHKCTESGSHQGLCDLTGVIVKAGEAQP